MNIDSESQRESSAPPCHPLGKRFLTMFSIGAIAILSLAGFAAERKASKVPGATSNLVILCTNGGDFSSSVAEFRGEVRVLDPQMYMECELLTVHFQTNNSSARVERPGTTNVNARIEMIVAETNFLMMARDTTILGDRAVYTATNEVVVVTGALVIIETDNSYTYGEHFVFNRQTGKGYAVGPTVVDIKMAATNAFKPGLGSPRRTNAPVNPAKTNNVK
jgi:lipopolysaccharide export system protein LptA